MEERKIITPLIRKNKKGMSGLELYETIPDHDFEDISQQLTKRLNLNDDTDLEPSNKKVLPTKKMCQKGFIYISEIDGVPITSPDQIEQIVTKQNKNEMERKEELEYCITDKIQYTVDSDDQCRDYKVLKIDELNYLEDLEEYKVPAQSCKVKRKKATSNCSIRIKICKIKF